MQLSCKKGVGFVCVPKCGSSTIEVIMRPHSDFQMSNNPKLKHIKFSEVEEFVFPLLSKMRIKKPYMFAIVREPISWVKSWYQYRAREELSPANHPQHRNYTGHLNFHEFVECCMLEKPPSFARIHSQSSFVLARDGSVGVDKLIPIDQIDTKLQNFLLRYNIQIPNKIVAKNQSKPRDTEPLPVELEQRLRTHLSSDFELYEKFSRDDINNKKEQ